METENLLSFTYIITFTAIFIAVIFFSLFFKIKNLFIRLISFIILIIIILNPVRNSSNKEYHKDLAIVVSDLTNSILETNKDKDVKAAQETLYDQLKKIQNLEIINIEINNNSEKNNNETFLFKEIDKKINNFSSDRLSSVFIITDGQIHDFDNYKSYFDSIPIHFLLVGSKNEKDRFLKVSNMPNYVLIGNKLKFDLQVIDNFNNKKIKTDFFIDSKLISSQYLVPNISNDITLPLNHVGKNILEIKTEVSSSEITNINNSQTFEINGVHDRLRVMLISGEPNMGLRNLRNILNSDPSVELIHFTILRPPSKRDLTPVKELSLIPFPTQELFAADISKFSLIIFDQYSLQGILPPKYLNNISNFVLNGGALLDIAGTKYLTPDSLVNSPIKEILPTEPLSIVSNKEIKPQLTKFGERHPITNSLKNNYIDNSWGNWNRFIKSKLISGKTLMHYKNSPLVVVDNVGEGRVAQILSDKTWIWKKSQDQKGPLVSLIRNIIHWLLKTPEMEENFLDIENNGNLVKIKLNSLIPGDNTAEITYPRGKKLTIKLKDNKKGLLEGSFSSAGTGKYKIKFYNQVKYIHLGKRNYKEIEDLKTTDNIIFDYFKNKSNSKNYSVFWYQDGIPKLIKVYSDNNIKGLNWAGIKENKVIKEGAYKKQSLFDWYILLLGLLMFLFLSWYRESKI